VNAVYEVVMLVRITVIDGVEPYYINIPVDRIDDDIRRPVARVDRIELRDKSIVPQSKSCLGVSLYYNAPEIAAVILEVRQIIIDGYQQMVPEFARLRPGVESEGCRGQMSQVLNGRGPDARAARIGRRGRPFALREPVIPALNYPVDFLGRRSVFRAISLNA
jgi:hypothetical protein